MEKRLWHWSWGPRWITLVQGPYKRTRGLLSVHRGYLKVSPTVTVSPFLRLHLSLLRFCLLYITPPFFTLRKFLFLPSICTHLPFSLVSKSSTPFWNWTLGLWSSDHSQIFLHSRRLGLILDSQQSHTTGRGNGGGEVRDVATSGP